MPPRPLPSAALLVRGWHSHSCCVRGACRSPRCCCRRLCRRCRWRLRLRSWGPGRPRGCTGRDTPQRTRRAKALGHPLYRPVMAVARLRVPAMPASCAQPAPLLSPSQELLWRAEDPIGTLCILRDSTNASHAHAKVVVCILVYTVGGSYNYTLFSPWNI